MKIIQLNTWNGRLELPIVELLKTEQPDIICLQEVVSVKGGLAGWFMLPIEDLNAKLDMHLAYAPFLGFKFMNRTAEVGNCILSTQPFSSQNVIFTGREYLSNFDSLEDDGNIRNLLHVTYPTDAGPLHVLTHHGHLVPGTKEGNEETLKQCQQIADYAASLDGKVILTGDFNLVPSSPSIQELSSVLRNLSTEYGLITTYSAVGKYADKVCDYIFVNDNVTVRSMRVSEMQVSDHLALIMEFD